MLDVYILYSGEINYLDFQIALLRKWVKGVENILVVQGPFNTKTIRATEMQEFGSFEGVRTILVPPEKNFVVSKFRRIERIYTYLMQELLVRKPKRTSLILHADMLPLEEFDSEKVLNGKYLAGCGAGGKLCPNLSWMLMENRVLSFNKTPLDYPDIMLYDTEVLTHQFLYYFKDSSYKEYSKTPMFYCQPGFVHLDHVSSDSSDVLEKKTQLLEENFLWLVERTT